MEEREKLQNNESQSQTVRVSAVGGLNTLIVEQQPTPTFNVLVQRLCRNERRGGRRKSEAAKEFCQVQERMARQRESGSGEKAGAARSASALKTIDSSTYREVQRLRRTRAEVLAAYSPVCAALHCSHTTSVCGLHRPPPSPRRFFFADFTTSPMKDANFYSAL
ncbi:hypothetical protein K0M31_002851 [Melipona bicolor]|uniref:Uncharacterized protein n=1 Tax=Melipona bicolor TaxID=60889 RepID=A0AA40FZV1_9HYME|nr:hypothetical protein K0M31_002851 [Melipona bicolor]